MSLWINKFLYFFAVEVARVVCLATVIICLAIVGGV